MILKRHHLLNRPSQVRQVFDKSYFLYLKRQELLDNALMRLKHHNKQDFALLEATLNGLYKRNQNTMNIYNISQRTVNSIQQATDNFIQQKMNTTQLDEQSLQLQNIGQDTHKKRIYKQTILKRAEIMNKMLEDPIIIAALQKNPEIQCQAIKNTIAMLQRIVENDEILLNAFQNTQTEYTIRKIDEVERLITDFDRYYQILKNLSSNKQLADVYGEAWEKTLAVYNNCINKKTNQTITHIIQDTFSKKTLGGISASRGYLESNIFDEQIVGNKQKQIKKNFNSTDSAEIVTIRSFDEKSGKVDVIFKLPEIQSDFKISAKSWSSSFQQHTFNETSLFNALIRTANLDYTLAYGLVVGYYNPPPGKLYEWVEAHEFAKTCILLDTVMGYSQKNNWVDTIVVENRNNKEKPVSVYSLQQILSQPLTEWEQYINYDPKMLNLRYVKRSEWWLKKIQTQMHSIKVSVSQGILNLATNNK